MPSQITFYVLFVFLFLTLPFPSHIARIILLLSPFVVHSLFFYEPLCVAFPLVSLFFFYYYYQNQINEIRINISQYEYSVFMNVNNVPVIYRAFPITEGKSCSPFFANAFYYYLPPTSNYCC